MTLSRDERPPRGPLNAPAPDAGSTVISPNRARQGRRSLRMFWVLAVSVILVAAAFLIIWAAQLGPHAPNRGQSQAGQVDASKFQSGAPGSASRQ